MFHVKIVGEELYLPKTPYTKQEMSGGYVTNIPNRIAVFKFKKVAETRIRQLQSCYSKQLEVVENN